MSGSAHVQSSEAIEVVKAALIFFKDQVDQALSTNDLEMRRVLDWLEHDRPRYWKTRVRVAHDEVTAAKAALTDGSLVIFKGPLNDNAGKQIVAPGASLVQTDVTLEKMAYLVEGVKGSIP